MQGADLWLNAAGAGSVYAAAGAGSVPVLCQSVAKQTAGVPGELAAADRGSFQLLNRHFPAEEVAVLPFPESANSAAWETH